MIKTKVSKNMKRSRIKTNIIERHKLFETPWARLDEMFVDGKLDAHKAFKEHGADYGWLYRNSNYDLIGWEIENGVFDWEKHSDAVAEHCPEYFDPEKFNWKSYSFYVLEYCPDKFDPKRYNWEAESSYVAENFPEKLDPERYDWEKSSWAVAMYCPEKLDPEKFNWRKCSALVAQYCPEKLDPERYNWEEHEWAVKKYCPEKLKLKPKRAVIKLKMVFSDDKFYYELIDNSSVFFHGSSDKWQEVVLHTGNNLVLFCNKKEISTSDIIVEVEDKYGFMLAWTVRMYLLTIGFDEFIIDQATF